MQLVGTVGDVLSRKGASVWSVSPHDKVYDAIERMAAHNVGALLVMEGADLVGLISERDYTRKVVLKGKSSKQVNVGAIMTAPVVAVEPDLPVADALQLMTQDRVRHLPVVSGGTVIGVVSIGDLVKWVIDAQSVAIEQLESYIGSSYPG
jgi:CBS domain-containing protein